MSYTTHGSGAGEIQISLLIQWGITDGIEEIERAVRREVNATKQRDPQFPVLRGITERSRIEVTYEGWLKVYVPLRQSEDLLSYTARLQEIEATLVEIALGVSQGNAVVVHVEGDPKPVIRTLERHEQLSAHESPTGSGRVVVTLKLESLAIGSEEYTFAREVLTKHIAAVAASPLETKQQGEAVVLRS